MVFGVGVVVVVELLCVSVCCCFVVVVVLARVGPRPGVLESVLVTPGGRGDVRAVASSLRGGLACVMLCLQPAVRCTRYPVDPVDPVDPDTAGRDGCFGRFTYTYIYKYIYSYLCRRVNVIQLCC